MSGIQSALVTGATGFIGSHLVRRLVAEGVTTYWLVRSSSKKRCVAGARLLQFSSINELSTALQGIQTDAVFHLASAGVLQQVDSPQATIDVNVNFMARLLEATSDWPLLRFFYTGSCSEYAASDEDLTEASPLLPDSVYGASKAAAFLCGRSLAKQLGTPFTNLRLFNVFGPGEADQRLLPYLIGQLRDGKPSELTGGEQMRDLLFVDDAVDAIWTAANTSVEDDVYNVCSGVGVPIRDVGETAARLLGASSELLQWGARPYRTDESMRIVGSNQKLVEATGWQPKTSLPNGISKMIGQVGQQRAA